MPYLFSPKNKTASPQVVWRVSWMSKPYHIYSFNSVEFVNVKIIELVKYGPNTGKKSI